MRRPGGTWQRCPFLRAFIPLPLPLCSHLLVLGRELGHLWCCLTNLGLGAAPVCKPHWLVVGCQAGGDAFAGSLMLNQTSLGTSGRKELRGLRRGGGDLPLRPLSACSSGTA